MNPMPISNADIEAWKNTPGVESAEAKVIGAPDGSLIGDGSSPDKAYAVEAVVAVQEGWPVFALYYNVSAEDLERLKNGGRLRLEIYGHNLPVYSLAALAEGEA